MKTTTRILAFLLFATFCFGQTVRTVLSEKTATKLDEIQVANMWARVGQAHQPILATVGTRIAPIRANNASLQVEQAQAVIDVTVSGENITATFQSLVSLPAGSAVAFRATLPNGSVLNMDGFSIGVDQNWAPSAEMWNGPFPAIWPSGWTLFEAVIISGNGGVSYTSAYAPVRACCAMYGPLTRADVGADGMTINIAGQFQGMTVATLNGNPVPISFTAGQPSTGSTAMTYTAGTISATSLWEGQFTLTVCSNGLCSSRVVYITASGTTGGKG